MCLFQPQIGFDTRLSRDFHCQKCLKMLCLEQYQNFYGKETLMSEKKTNKPKCTSMQIVALAGVILLIALYIITLFVAILNPDGAGMLFRGCLGATIIVPILIWIYIWMYGKLTNRHTIADADYLTDLKIEDDE